jgi:hypothetical protein
LIATLYFPAKVIVSIEKSKRRFPNQLLSLCLILWTCRANTATSVLTFADPPECPSHDFPGLSPFEPVRIGKRQRIDCGFAVSGTEGLFLEGKGRDRGVSHPCPSLFTRKSNHQKK